MRRRRPGSRTFGVRAPLFMYGRPLSGTLRPTRRSATAAPSRLGNATSSSRSPRAPGNASRATTAPRETPLPQPRLHEYIAAVTRPESPSHRPCTPIPCTSSNSQPSIDSPRARRRALVHISGEGQSVRHRTQAEPPVGPVSRCQQAAGRSADASRQLASEFEPFFRQQGKARNIVKNIQSFSALSAGAAMSLFFGPPPRSSLRDDSVCAWDPRHTSGRAAFELQEL